MKLHERVLPLILGIFCCGFLSGCATYSVVGSFSDYKEVFKGTVHANLLAGVGAIQAIGQVTGMSCGGKSWVTYVPPSGSCEGQQGKALLTCTDGRVVEADWIATSCTSGWGHGVDQNGNRFVFAFGMDEKTASQFVKQQLGVAASKPELPPVYQPKETRREKGYSTGTGFFVTVDGFLITNFHVVDGASELAVITSDGRNLPAKLIQGDPANDVALLKVDAVTQPLAISDNSNLSKGEDVFTLGYPLVAIEGQDQKATFGRVNSLSGIANDIRFVQIDVPIQPGNSGSPLMSREGHVVGICSATLDALVTLRASGSLPQNVNYAVKSDYIIPLLRSVAGANVKPTADSGEDKPLKELIKIAEPSVVLVIAK